MPVEDGQVVTVEYTVRLEDGTLLDSTGACGPISVMYGSAQLFPALEDRVGRMKVGETCEFVIPAEEAYGPWEPSRVGPIPRHRLPPDLDLEVGARYSIRASDGRLLRFRLVEVRPEEIVADFNPPQAGKSLLATVTLVATRRPTPAEERRGRV